jgi:hypothetical protein
VHAAADVENSFKPGEVNLLQTNVWRVATRKQNGKLNIKEYLMLNSTDGRTDDRMYTYENTVSCVVCVSYCHQHM